MSIRSYVWSCSFVLMSCTSHVATFYSVDEGKVAAERRWDGEPIPTHFEDIDLRLFMDSDEIDQRLNLLPEDTFRLGFVATSTGSTHWLVDSIFIADVSLHSSGPPLTVIPRMFRSEMSSSRWYQLYEMFVMPRGVKEIQVDMNVLIYANNSAYEERLTVNLFRKDVSWSGPPKGLFH